MVDRQVLGWFNLYLSPDVTREDVAELLQRLNALELVDIAYAVPRTEGYDVDTVPWPSLGTAREHDHRTSAPPPVKKK